MTPTSGRNCSPGWHGVELRHLITLQAVASERSFSAAATKLGYTQSAISGHILALERVIGARVFERIRGSRPAQVTPEGKILLEHAAAIVARLEAAHAELRALQSGGARAVRVGTSPGVSPLVVPYAVGGLESDVELERGDVEKLLELVERGRLDLAIVPLPVRAGPFVTAELYRDEDVLVVRRADPLAARSAVSGADLEGVPVVVLGVSAAEASLSLDVARRVDDAGALVGFVSSGSAAGLLPSHALELPSSLAPVRIDAAVPPRVFAAVWNGALVLSDQARRFVELAARPLKPSLARVS